jgi:hypothetical protein
MQRLTPDAVREPGILIRRLPLTYKMNETDNNESNPMVNHTTTDGLSDAPHERIAKAAYFIWVSEGRPEGREEAHWQEAQQQLLRDDTGGNS